MRTRVFGRDLGRESEDVGQRLGAEAEQRGQRHAVHVAAGRGLGGVDVGVGVDPDEADLLVFAAVELGHAGDRSGGDGVIAAEDDGRHAFFERVQDGFGGVGAGLGDFA